MPRLKKAMEKMERMYKDITGLIAYTFKWRRRLIYHLALYPAQCQVSEMKPPTQRLKM
jgi:hypothetical protein